MKVSSTYFTIPERVEGWVDLDPPHCHVDDIKASLSVSYYRRVSADGRCTDDHSAEIRAFHSRQFWPLAPRRTVLRVSVIWSMEWRKPGARLASRDKFDALRRRRRRRRLKCLPHQVARPGVLSLACCRIQSINIRFLSPSSSTQPDVISGAQRNYFRLSSVQGFVFWH